MKIRVAIGRMTFSAVYGVLSFLRRAGREALARRLYSWFWRSGLRDWADRMEHDQ